MRKEGAGRRTRSLSLRTSASVRDARNKVRWGLAAPRHAQRIWVDPSACTSIRYGIARSRSGDVAPGDWDLQPSLAVEDSPNIVACRAHWEDGVTWEDTGVFGYLSSIIERKGHADGCRTLDELVERYDQIDRLFEALRREGRLRTRRELREGSFRESGGVFIHISRNLEPIFGGGGHHRLAASLVLGFDRIPAQVGVVHPEALSAWRSTFGVDAPVAGAGKRARTAQ